LLPLEDPLETKAEGLHQSLSANGLQLGMRFLEGRLDGGSLAQEGGDLRLHADGGVELGFLPAT